MTTVVSNKYFLETFDITYVLRNLSFYFHVSENGNKPVLARYTAPII